MCNSYTRHMLLKWDTNYFFSQYFLDRSLSFCEECDQDSVLIFIILWGMRPRSQFKCRKKSYWTAIRVTVYLIFYIFVLHCDCCHSFNTIKTLHFCCSQNFLICLNIITFSALRILRPWSQYQLSMQLTFKLWPWSQCNTLIPQVRRRYYDVYT